MLNQAIYIRLLILFCALSMVQPIKLFKINVEVCRPIIATSNIIEYPYSTFLTNTAALLKWLPPTLHIASGAPGCVLDSRGVQIRIRFVRISE
jgi:hypothetical protein